MSEKNGIDGIKEEPVSSFPQDELKRENYKKSVPGKRQPYRQDIVYGCGAYALANLFNDGRFIQTLREDGDNIATLNKLLSEYRPEYYLQTLMLMQTFTAHDRITDTTIFDTEVPSEYAKPILMIVYFPKQRTFHYITVLQNFANNLFYVCDSRLNHVQKFTIEEMFRFYWIVGFEVFCRWDRSVNDEIAFPKEILQHLIPWGE